MSMAFNPERWKPAALLPREEANDGALVFVVAVLCFLACATAIFAISADRAAQGWANQLQGSATVIIRTKGSESPDMAASRAAEALAGTPGVAQALVLERAKAEALLEPWLGKDGIIKDLPVPRLVTVELDPSSPASAKALDNALRAAGVDATVDDHSLWMKDIIHAGQIARIAAVSLFALMALAAASVIAFATRAGLSARHDVVEIMHLTGATDGFIANLFQARFAAMAALAGLMGGGAAALLAAGIRLLGGGYGLLPVLPIGWLDLLVALPSPVIAGLVAAIAARVTALGLIRAMP